MITVKEISPPKKVSGVSSLICQFDYRPDIVDALRAIQAAYYHKKEKIWEVPVNQLCALMDSLTILDDITLTLWEQPEIRQISETDLTSNEIARFKFPPYNHQIEAINYGLSAEHASGWLLLDSMGLGKLEPISADIPTLNGYKKMGEIVPGDFVFGSDGNPYEVLQTFPHKDKEIYRMTFTDGTFADCGLDHLWICRDGNMRTRHKGWTVKSTRELMSVSLYSGNCANWEIPIAQPVQYPARDYFIHPYIMGMCIGDGSLTRGTPAISIPDTEAETVERITSYLHTDYTLNKTHVANACPQYNIVGKERPERNLYRREFTRLGLNVTSHFKFIPEEYKLGSVQQRLDLLRGLMDSDGSITKTKNKISFGTVSRQLAEDLKELVYSLGGKAKIHVYIRKRTGNTEYIVSLNSLFNPFYLTRKAERYTKTTTKYVSRHIKSIEYNRNEDAQCLMVNSPDHSYLTGKYYIVTHNTYSLMCLAETLHHRGLIDHCLIITGVDSLRSNWRNECLKFSNETAVVLGEKRTKSGRVYYAPLKERVEILKGPIEEFFVITNISSLRDESLIDAINKSGKFGMMAFDEAHRGSKKSQMGNNLLKLKADYKVAATGTLITNNPQSAFVPLVWTGNEHATLTTFKNQYCEMGGQFSSYQVTGYKNLDLLRDLIDNCSLRRTLDQVRDDMPAKTVETELVEMSDVHKKFYDAIKDGVKEEADKIELNSNNLLALTTRLRQATACPSFLTTNPPESSKVERCLELIEDLIDQGEKVVILSMFKETVDVLASELSKFDKFRFTVNTGDVSDDVVFRNIDEFQNDPNPQIFIGTWAKCSTGITLNAASYMICLDTPYTDAMFQQGCDRIYRVTNTRPAFIKVLLCKDTIDERVWKIIETKRDLADYLVDGKETQQMQESLAHEMRSIISDL